MTIWLPDGYPLNINLQRDILALLTLIDGSLFCSMALITIDRGISPSICFAGIDIKETKMFALADELVYSPASRGYRVIEVIIGGSISNLTDCRLSMVIVSNSTKINGVNFYLIRYY